VLSKSTWHLFLFSRTTQKAKLQAKIQQAGELANEWNLAGTPTYYINGKRVAHRDMDQFAAELDQAINK